MQIKLHYYANQLCQLNAKLSESPYINTAWSSLVEWQPLHSVCAPQQPNQPSAGRYHYYQIHHCIPATAPAPQCTSELLYADNLMPHLKFPPPNLHLQINTQFTACFQGMVVTSVQSLHISGLFCIWSFITLVIHLAYCVDFGAACICVSS